MKRDLLTLPLLISVIGAPVVIGWLLILNPRWLPETSSSNGELIVPARPIGDLTLSNRIGSPVQMSSLRGRWVLVLYVNACLARCSELLMVMRQVRLALGSDRAKVKRLLIVEEQPSADLLKHLEQAHPDMEIIIPSKPSVQEFTNRLPSERSASADAYVVDPQGNLMMRYVWDVPGEAILKDMQRLMKVSL